MGTTGHDGTTMFGNVMHNLFVHELVPDITSKAEQEFYGVSAVYVELDFNILQKRAFVIDNSKPWREVDPVYKSLSQVRRYFYDISITFFNEQGFKFFG